MAITTFQSTLFTLLALIAAMASATAPLRNIMYLTGQHPITPDLALSSSITHVAMAFMRPDLFNREQVSSTWPLFMSVSEARSKFRPGTKIMVAIGGWGDSAGFDIAARTDESQARFARNIAAMVRDTGADGVDIDWEYPGGNGEDWKKVPNDERTWQIAAFPKLLCQIRKALGSNKLISAAVPGLPRDMLAFKSETVPQIMGSLDFLNVMTYDLMNRRDSVTKHHTGVQASLESVHAYIANGASRDKINLGFAFYAKYFLTERGPCVKNPIGCPTGPMEDPVTGADLGRAGSFSWRDEVPQNVKASFNKAMTQGHYDEVGGGYYYWDEQEAIWWTFDTPVAIAKKFPLIVEKEKLGGVFAWGLGEDAPRWDHLKALNAGVKSLSARKEEL
ncbi:glycoside hydrolase family 18 protein [Annulohypoxylon maeteangense]|uniref:glycoside hydrolase family 18 protein n=1 Tax=Annulohypoxylon maeteangense TaxID=1927788 RepID=UPI002007DBF5|nr:glycoside hydrolase family 18 protein [Annulohypoxylon maeteangense]KAI0881384.1 glycoside hydrolase family 18 protein [Annulohypoxylon maeteangense]